MRIILRNSANVTKQVAYPTLSLLKPNITWRKKDEEGFKAFSFTGDLEFIGEDYYFIKAELWDAVNAIQNEILLTFEDDCCGGNPFAFSFTLPSESIKWCEGSCSITAAAIEKSVESEAIKCLRNTKIADDDNGSFNDSQFSTDQPGIPFKSKRHPRMTYCHEIRPSWMHDVAIIFTIIIESALTSAFPIIGSVIGIIVAINNVISFLNNNLGTNINLLAPINGAVNDPNSLQSWYNAFSNTKNDLYTKMIGCGKKHPSPLIRTYAENVCARCGISFRSSIFKNPASDYNNAVYHFAPVSHGTDFNDTTTFWIPENEPYVTGSQFFDQLKSTFNGDWQVVNNALVFERKDFFQAKQPWLDLTVLDSDQYNICYAWSKKVRPSFGKFEYRKDGINTVGNEAADRYNDWVEWNKPPLPGQKGEFAPVIPFAACRFRDDHVRLNNVPERDVLTSYENNSLVPATMRNKMTAGKNAIILNQHICEAPMILIWDGAGDRSDSRVSGTQFTPTGGTTDASAGEFYNYPMWFSEAMPGGNGVAGNMYDRFWAIENPRITGFQAKTFEAEIELTCLQLQNMDLDGMVKTNEGTGKVTEISINYQSNKMIIKGEI